MRELGQHPKQANRRRELARDRGRVAAGTPWRAHTDSQNAGFPELQLPFGDADRLRLWVRSSAGKP